MKAVSPVFVIFIAVAIALSIALALLITGLLPSFIGVEKLEIVNAYAKSGTDANGNTYWLVHVVVKNTGTKSAVINNIFINNKPGTITNAYADDVVIPSTGITLDPGKTTTIVFLLTSTGTEECDIGYPSNIIKYKTRSDPKPNEDVPYISKYPVLITNKTGSHVNFIVTITLQGGINEYDLYLYDHTGKLVNRQYQATIYNTCTNSFYIILPDKKGSYTWKINLTKANNKNIVYDSVSFTINVVESISPIVTDRFSSGQTVNIVIYTASGGQYPATITLP